MISPIQASSGQGGNCLVTEKGIYGIGIGITFYLDLRISIVYFHE
jgi:hypothetical protein